jgi:hypothetical protein
MASAPISAALNSSFSRRSAIIAAHLLIFATELTQHFVDVGQDGNTHSSMISRGFMENLTPRPELENSLGHFRQINPLPALSACPLRSDRVRTFAPQRFNAVCY